MTRDEHDIIVVTILGGIANLLIPPVQYKILLLLLVYIIFASLSGWEITDVYE